MRLRLKDCDVRSWTHDDAEAIVRHANSRHVSATLRGGFPFPYTLADARSFLHAMVPWDALRLTRIYALVFEWNAPSVRVLEKAGYVLEGRLPKHTLKDDQLVDRLVYATVRQP